MKKIIIQLPERVKVSLRELRRSAKDAGLAMRCQAVLLAAKGRSSREISDAVGFSRSWVSRVIARFDALGLGGLADRREDNGTAKVDEWFLDVLYDVVGNRPSDYGFARPTWTRELLVKVMARLTNVRIHVSTMSRALKSIGARRGRPRPSVRCPWSRPCKERRLRAIRRLAKSPPRGEVVLYSDEVDVHLNPKIGLDWMNRGQQKEVVTPGKNEKRYLAGALDSATGRLTCVEGMRKTSELFIALLAKLVRTYPGAKRIHLILDNYRIHHSAITKIALRHFARKVVLHFLPPYCPNDNKIERVWQDLHAEVTRNHERSTMDALMKDVWRFLRKRGKTAEQVLRRRAA
jgi:transposase